MLSLERCKSVQILQSLKNAAERILTCKIWFGYRRERARQKFANKFNFASFDPAGHAEVLNLGLGLAPGVRRADALRLSAGERLADPRLNRMVLRCVPGQRLTS